MTPLLILGLLGGQAGPPPADSIRLHRAMQAAQAAFERDRRALLPVTTAGLGRCDVRIGRFCYWYDEEEPAPPPEPARIVALRERLLRRLGEAAVQVPGDRWVAGQRVRYFAEAGLVDSAVVAAASCRAELWWCSGLLGFALHAGSRFRAADSAFRVSRASMPESERCRWNDLSDLLEAEVAAGYRALDCGGRDSANTRIFWVGTPLHGNGGYDLSTEIFARQMLSRMLDGAVTHHGGRAGPDYTELLFRYGWAVAYGRRHDPLAPPDRIDVVGHEPKPSYPLLAWQPGRSLTEINRPRFRYAPRYLTRLDELDAVQVARFRRGADSVVVVVSYDAKGSGGSWADSAAGALILSGESGQVAERASLHGSQGGALVRGPTTANTLSLELGDATQGAWLRFRDLLAPADAAISDLLLVVPDSAAPATLAEAASRALPGNRLARNRPVGVYWETYGDLTDNGPEEGMGDGRAVEQHVRLSVTPVRAGLMTRVGRALGVVRGAHRLDLAWRQAIRGEEGVARHAIELDLSRLRPGAYLAAVSVGGPGAPAVTTSRVFVLEANP